MMDEADKHIHKQFAVALFNQTWDLLEKANRNQLETDRMIHSAHASRYHWEFAGDIVNIQRGEWMISHVYAALKRVEPCLYHANRCLEITLENDIKDFDLAFAYEAMARGFNIAGNEIETAKYLTHAKATAAHIKDTDDRKYFLSQLETIHSLDGLENEPQD